jgi:hypothetical protein
MISDLNSDHAGDMIFTEENPRNWALSGYDLAEAAAAIDNWLALHSVDTNADKNIFLINLGIITAVGETEANFKSNYLYIIDAIRAVFANAEFYLTYPWSGNTGTRPATIKPWINDGIAARSTFVHAGDDESLWLPAVADADTLHYFNAAGQAAAIVAKRAATGY